MNTGLGVYYFLVALMNAGFAAHFHFSKKNATQVAIWSLVTLIFLVHGCAYLGQAGWIIPQWIRQAVDWLMGPTNFFVGTVFALAVILYWRDFFTEPLVAWSLLQATLLLSGWAMTDANFAAIITKPDNVPIVMLIFSVAFFTWVGLRQAVVNDQRLARGEPPLEKLDEDKTLVWPDLVYIELIAMVICTLILTVWSIVLKAPLEQPASTARIPNPSKAPWYFLGLQEMLVYFDPWMAGVVLPTFIIIGLIAIPYIDFNQKGIGFYTFTQRKFAVTTFLYGFVVLWVVLIVLGTFMRGPNWNFFGPFEPWDVHKNVPLGNRNLSDYFWLDGLGLSVQRWWLWREMPGILFMLAYLFLLPPLLAKTVMRTFFIKMGFVRFFVLVTLIQFMVLMPLKMVLRWYINLKYIVFIPEAFFNI